MSDGPRTSPESAATLPIVAATAALRRMREALQGGADLAEAVAEAGAGLPRAGSDAFSRVRRRMGGSYEEDPWGLDEDFMQAALPVLDFLYEAWWRVRVTGVRNVPGEGRALLVSNHAGIMPWDGSMIAMSLLRNHEQPRYTRFLVLNWAFRLPYASVAIRKVGGVPASPHNARRLLEDDELVAVFPEGVKGAGKPYSERYRLQRFGRGGFVELALATGAPIIPVAVVGSEEIHPKLGESGLLARLTGAPYFPLTPTFPWLGPLGVVPLPSKWRIEFCDPIPVAHLGPDAINDPHLVLELSDRVRQTIQDTVFRNLVERGNAFL